MFMTKLAILYSVLLIAVADAFPGMIPNSARQDAPISDTQPIRLSSVSGGATSSLLAHTLSSSLPVDPSAIATSTALLSAPTTTNQAGVAETTMAVSTPDIVTMTHDVAVTVQTQETATESPASVVHLPPRGPFMTV
ncbi:hypothetical protein V8D89_001269 [Ganoderma adspersum]